MCLVKYMNTYHFCYVQPLKQCMQLYCCYLGNMPGGKEMLLGSQFTKVRFKHQVGFHKPYMKYSFVFWLKKRTLYFGYMSLPEFLFLFCFVLFCFCFVFIIVFVCVLFVCLVFGDVRELMWFLQFGLTFAATSLQYVKSIYYNKNSDVADSRNWLLWCF